MIRSLAPYNNTPHADAREASYLGRLSLARAGGRGRYGAATIIERRSGSMIAAQTHIAQQCHTALMCLIRSEKEAKHDSR